MGLFTSECGVGYATHVFLLMLSCVLVPAVITMTFVTFAIRNLALPAGGLSLLLVPNALLMFGLGAGRGEAPYGPVVLAALAGAAAAELCLWL